MQIAHAAFAAEQFRKYLHNFYAFLIYSNMSKKLILPIFIYCLCILLAFPMQCRMTVTDTLRLWYESVIPSLMPTILLVQYYLLLRPISDSGMVFGATLSLACGFPIGTIVGCHFYDSGRISKQQVLFYCAAVNQFSPAFIQTYVAQLLLHQTSYIVLLQYYGVLLFSSGFVYLPYRFFCKNQKSEFSTTKETLLIYREEQPLTKAILLSSEILLRLFVYMFLCNGLIRMVRALPRGTVFATFIAPFCEITSGLLTYANGDTQTNHTALLFAALNFGGISGFLQVMPFLQKRKLSIHTYLFLKSVLAITTFMLVKGISLFI
ncbi:hypothetical protein SAMN02910358_00154 [Lachnospiraceae bacterium XBB1006]|nr:hypothetical protein SAMN02910358_00154 [Lachnospiraceae bacterium XBB1006]